MSAEIFMYCFKKFMDVKYPMILRGYDCFCRKPYFLGRLKKYVQLSLCFTLWGLCETKLKIIKEVPCSAIDKLLSACCMRL